MKYSHPKVILKYSTTITRTAEVLNLKYEKWKYSQFLQSWSMKYNYHRRVSSKCTRSHDVVW